MKERWLNLTNLSIKQKLNLVMTLITTGGGFKRNN